MPRKAREKSGYKIYAYCLMGKTIPKGNCMGMSAEEYTRIRKSWIIETGSGLKIN